MTQELVKVPIKLRPETEKFWNYVRKMARKYQYYLQQHSMGIETNVVEDSELEEIWLHFQLRVDPEDQPL